MKMFSGAHFCAGAKPWVGKPPPRLLSFVFIGYQGHPCAPLQCFSSGCSQNSITISSGYEDNKLLAYCDTGVFIKYQGHPCLQSARIIKLFCRNQDGYQGVRILCLSDIRAILVCLSTIFLLHQKLCVLCFSCFQNMD